MQEKYQILIVDDEQQMQLAMEAVLARSGHAVLKCSNGQEALEVLERAKVDLIISDMRMPVMTGNELLEKLHELYPRIPVVMITAYGTITQAVEAMKNGAFDFITKPFSAEDLEGVIARALNPARRIAGERETTKPRTPSIAIVTADPGFKRILELVVSVAPSSASVLVQGESGTGKELLARLIHTSSGRTGPFVAVNCAALPENLLESELFGHEKGSFTGAVGTKIGKFELANGGTILLDEISEMDQLLQAKLLRVLQEREVDRVGSQKPIPVDVRVIATTNRDLRKQVQTGGFREDLYYRLNVIPVYIPPLRERKGDIRLLVEHFVRRFSADNPKSLAPGLLERLTEYPWPGNIRELQNACERAVLLSAQGELDLEKFLLGSLQPVERSESDELRIHSGLSVAEAEKRLIFETLRVTGNNKTKAAELLGISIRTLRNKLNEYGVATPDM
ncbi:MAG: sigma-54 dependent transcriptional regulator [Bdellovibrionota bacterium]